MALDTRTGVLLGDRTAGASEARRGEGHVRTEAELGVVRREVIGCQELPAETRGRHRMDSSSDPQEEPTLLTLVGQTSSFQN